MKNTITILILTAMVLLSGCATTKETAIGSSSSPAVNNAANVVVIQNFAFDPVTLTIKAGETVTWINQDSATHTIKSAEFNSGSLSKGDNFQFNFPKKGTYEYSCGIHPSMTGKIVVG